MSAPNRISHIISTPTGRRMLHIIGGDDYAVIGKPYGPDDPAVPSERLQVRRKALGAEAAPDGVWINSKQLYAVGMALACRRRAPISAQEVADDLFYDAARPNAGHLMRLFMMTPQNTDWLQSMRGRFGYFDVASGEFVPLPNWESRLMASVDERSGCFYLSSLFSLAVHIAHAPLQDMR